MEVQIRGPATPLPKHWQKYIGNSENKTNLSALLASSWQQLGMERLENDEEIVIGGGDLRIVIAAFL